VAGLADLHYHDGACLDVRADGSVYCRIDDPMAIDPGANKAYHEAKNVKFAVGQSVWVNGIQFAVVQIVPVSPATPSGQLILQPVTAKV